MVDCSEPTIAVNGQPLTIGQALAVRVAVTVFCMEMNEEDVLGTDEHGVKLATAYKDRLIEVLRLMQVNDLKRRQ